MNPFLAQYGLLITTMLTNVVLGLSVQVVLRSGVFSLASAGFFGISAYTTAILSKTVPFGLAIVAGIALSCVVSLGLALLLTRLRGLYLGMGTIAFDLLVVTLALSWNPVTGGSAGLFGIPLAMNAPLALVLAAVAVLAVALWHSSAGGRFADVLRLDEPLARSLGIATGRRRIGTFVFSAALGALAGGMSALTFGVLVPTDSGFSLVVLALTIAIIGGTGSWVGPVIGAIVVTMLPRVLSFMAEWSDVVYGVLIAVVVIFAPRGLFGLLQSLWSLIRRRRVPRTLSVEPERIEVDA